MKYIILIIAISLLVIFIEFDKEREGRILVASLYGDFIKLSSKLEASYLEDGFFKDQNEIVTTKYLNSWDSPSEFKYYLHIRRQKVIMKLEEGVSVLEGMSIEFCPIVINNEVEWGCEKGTIPAKYRWIDCAGEAKR